MSGGSRGTIQVQNEALRQMLLSEPRATGFGSTSELRNASQVSSRSRPQLANGSRSSPVMNPAPTSRASLQPQRTARNLDVREKTRVALREKYEEEEARIKRNTQLRRERERREEEERFSEMYNDLMMEEEDFVSMVSEYCTLDDENKRRKQEALCREWHEKVFNRVQRQIGKQLSAVSSAEIAERRRRLYDQFLAAANSKESGLFRDIIIESEYDPMVAHKHTIKYKSYVENDPVKLETNKAEREAQTIPGEFKAKVPLGRETLKCTMWDKLEATPYGRFNKMMAATKADHGTFKVNLQMDHYTFERGKQVTDSEFPQGKKTFPGWQPGKTLHDLDTGTF